MSDTKTQKQTEARQGRPSLTPCSAVVMDCARTILQEGRANTHLLMRRHRLGYCRAANALDALQGMGMIGPQDGARPRSVDLKKIAEHLKQNDQCPSAGETK